ncbi:short chain dehydrogenase/reductase [Mytilinidion resinicola]|uniref:Short-chain dehydrogenase/reductase 3 n=1 Tax=Mytilinidion resinicola TaxID=574789 RepID=A0A6A6YV72_9PEZI|nr:short chain dehydrogenase/reductase [Mytilinidion resinicola]KAF2812419.1 short chain dehydrogenase/reductase [Mytilinidion resinicola]
MVQTIPAKMPEGAIVSGVEKPWHHYLTLDLIVNVLSYTVLHPFVAWMIPLCLRAQATPYDHPSMYVTVAWASLLTVYGILGLINDRIAYGPPREVDLSEEVIVITGGASGLGALIAEVYGMRNANIAVLDVKKFSEDEAEEKGIAYYECDVGDPKQVEAAGKRIVEDLGVPTILINNAGIVHGKSLLELSSEEIEKTFRINTLSHFHTLRAFLPGMLEEERGTVVTVSSVLGHLGAANLSDYTASKAALLAMHASLEAELARDPRGQYIRTILCKPGQFSTPMFANVKTPSAFLAPVLAPVDIAKEIIRLVDGGRGGTIAVPLYARWIDVLGVLPAGLQYLVRRWSGVDNAMAGVNPSSAKKVGTEKKG